MAEVKIAVVAAHVTFRFFDSFHPERRDRDRERQREREREKYFKILQKVAY